MQINVSLCVYLYVDIGMYVCMHACMHVCMHEEISRQISTTFDVISNRSHIVDTHVYVKINKIIVLPQTVNFGVLNWKGNAPAGWVARRSVSWGPAHRMGGTRI